MKLIRKLLNNRRCGLHLAEAWRAALLDREISKYLKIGD